MQQTAIPMRRTLCRSGSSTAPPQLLPEIFCHTLVLSQMFSSKVPSAPIKGASIPIRGVLLSPLFSPGVKLALRSPSPPTPCLCCNRHSMTTTRGSVLSLVSAGSICEMSGTAFGYQAVQANWQGLQHFQVCSSGWCVCAAVATCQS